MNTPASAAIAMLFAVLTAGVSIVAAAEPRMATDAPLTVAGQALEKTYADQLNTQRAEIEKALPTIDEQKKAALAKAHAAVTAAQTAANAAQLSLGRIQEAKALVEHAKGKWIGDAQKNIAKAEAALKNATTETDRDLAKKELAKWQANREEGIAALKERQAALDKVASDGPQLAQAHQAAQEALTRAQAGELTVSNALLAEVAPFLASGTLDPQLVTCAVLAEATPRGLAAFAQQGKEQEALVDSLLADSPLMKQMLEAGGAKFRKYGRAMEIYAAIRKASPKANAGSLQRLALATSLEHAVAVEQSNAKDQTTEPTTVDPVKRYLQYEKAYLDGELDPAFANLTAWEYRMVVNSDAPDHILAWGREMLRNYRPDHVSNPDYGWRYSAAVRTEVPYGSQNVKNDLPSLQNYQNIIKDGGVCGRRAFFGRFILQCFGIPTWGVTQHKHAALSHWTPKGWLVNLGAGFAYSWWDKDEAPRSGLDFLLETQARAVPQEYIKVLRAQWVSHILGEQAYNHRKDVSGGWWSHLAHDQAQAIATAAKAVDLGPLGQELAEANEPKGKDTAEPVQQTGTDATVSIGKDGVITIPSVAHGTASGHSIAAKSFSGGMQLHCTGGFAAAYACEAPHAGTYALTARVVTAQEGQTLRFAANDARAPVDIAVPYTVGKWGSTPAAEFVLVAGKNVIHMTLKEGSRGVSIKDLTLTPMK